MKQVSNEVFEGFRELYKFVQLDFKLPIESGVKFYGYEFGDSVLLITVYNGDISTSAMELKNHQILTSGGKFIVAPRGAQVTGKEKLTKDITDEEFERELEKFPKKTPTLEEARMAAIAAADNDNSIQLQYNGNVDEQQDDGNDDDDDVSKYIDSLIKGKQPKAAPKPIITKGEKPSKPVVNKPVEAPNPEPEVKKFGGW